MRSIILIGLAAAVLALVIAIVITVRGAARRRRRAAARWEYFSRYAGPDVGGWEVGVALTHPDGEVFDREVMHTVPHSTPTVDLLDLEAEAIAEAGYRNGGTP